MNVLKRMKIGRKIGVTVLAMLVPGMPAIAPPTRSIRLTKPLLWPVPPNTSSWRRNCFSASTTAPSGNALR